MSQRNIIVTPFFIRAWNSHFCIYNCLYRFPFDLKFNSGTISFHVDSPLQLKYIPFIITQLIITACIGLGSCVFLPVYKLFHPAANYGILTCFICVLLGSCAFLQCGIYTVCTFGTELETLMNQLFYIERSCKSIAVKGNLSIPNLGITKR